MDENIIEKDIKRGVEMAFSWFKKNNPSLEQHCDEDTLQNWYDFIAFCYTLDCGEDIESELNNLKKSNQDFDFEISLLMQNAIEEAGSWWVKYNCDHQDEAFEYANEQGYEEEAEDQAYYELEDAYERIRLGINTKNFKELSKFRVILESKNDKQEIPDWFKGVVYKEGKLITRKNSGQQCMLTALEASIYDYISGSELVRGLDLNAILQRVTEKHGKLAGMPPENFDLNANKSDDSDIEKAKKWFQENNPEAYKILF